VTTFITKLEATGSGATLAVKDLIDVVGVMTTGGSKAIAKTASPAIADAACLAGARAAGVRIVGKTNLHELAFGTTGINESYGTPHNPFDPTLIPGGSSSGSAVAVAIGDAELAFGSDTGGSIRIPAALCGVTGMKTTFGRIPLGGVLPLAPSLDTVGPMARDISGVVRAMALLEPGFAPLDEPALTIGRLRLPETTAEPEIEVAIDEALAAAHLMVTDIELDEWTAVSAHAVNLLLAEAAAVNRPILEDPDRRALLGSQVAARLAAASAITRDQVAAARAVQTTWAARLGTLFAHVDLLALPSVPWFPVAIEDATSRAWNAFTLPFNLAGVPALSQPVRGGWIPPSLQLVGPLGSEELLVATGAVIEAVAGSTWRG
jgi:amidase